MPLKLKFATRAEIPAELAGLYVERDGAWCLDVEAGSDRARLDEFRANNIALQKQVNELTSRFEGIDPDEVRKLAAEKQRLEEQALIKAGEAEKVIESRLRAARVEMERNLSAVRTERDALNTRLAVIQIDQAAVSEATKRRLLPSAIPDLTARVRNTFRLVNGVPQAFEADGQTVRTGKDGLTPLTLGEWTESLVAEAPHLFEPSAGGGAAGGGPGGAAGGGVGKNPFARATWNLTEQMILTKKDPQLAARLSAAG